jgi:crotonobetainyl-CoA:carnitine CoA-transferase CaiB-like acyl-CoA transferase
MTDKLCGVYLAFAVAAALTERERSGRGQQVQVPMFETMAAFNLLDHMADGVFADDGAPLGYARAFGKYHRPLATADGSICLIANTDAQWKRLFELLGLPELAADARFADIGSRIRHIDALYQLVEERLKARPSSEWLALLEAADLPVGPANDLNALREDPHLAQTGFFQQHAHESEGQLSFPALPLEMSRTPGGLRLGPPRLGQHTEEVLAGLG